MKEKYIIEYHDIKKRLMIYKNKIEELNNKYSDDYWKSLIMEVIWWLYNNRKWWDYDDWSYYYLENILDNYDSKCWVKFEDLTEIMNLFIQRKKDKRRLWFLKWLAVRETFK